MFPEAGTAEKLKFSFNPVLEFLHCVDPIFSQTLVDVFFPTWFTVLAGLAAAAKTVKVLTSLVELFLQPEVVVDAHLKSFAPFQAISLVAKVSKTPVEVFLHFVVPDA